MHPQATDCIQKEHQQHTNISRPVICSRTQLADSAGSSSPSLNAYIGECRMQIRRRIQVLTAAAFTVQCIFNGYKIGINGNVYAWISYLAFIKKGFIYLYLLLAQVLDQCQLFYLCLIISRSSPISRWPRTLKSNSKKEWIWQIIRILTRKNNIHLQSLNVINCNE